MKSTQNPFGERIIQEILNGEINLKRLKKWI